MSTDRNALSIYGRLVRHARYRFTTPLLTRTSGEDPNLMPIESVAASGTVAATPLQPASARLMPLLRF